MNRCRILTCSGLMILFGCLLSVGTNAQSAERPEAFVSISDLDSTIVRDMAYYGNDNFVGVPIDGYMSPSCILSRPAAEALVNVHLELREFGLGLKVFDCYRPQTAVNHFIRWAKDSSRRTKSRYYPNVDKTRVFDLGYVASRSGHSRGSTVDLTIVAMDAGRNEIHERTYDCRMPEYAGSSELDMGTGYDCFDELSHTKNPGVSREAKKNRLLLRAVMEKHGFDNYSKEWWHYTYRNEPFRDTYFDFPVDD